jgi:hypothetical protein
MTGEKSIERKFKPAIRGLAAIIFAALVACGCLPIPVQPGDAVTTTPQLAETIPPPQTLTPKLETFTLIMPPGSTETATPKPPTAQEIAIRNEQILRNNLDFKEIKIGSGFWILTGGEAGLEEEQAERLQNYLNWLAQLAQTNPEVNKAYQMLTSTGMMYIRGDTKRITIENIQGVWGVKILYSAFWADSFILPSGTGEKGGILLTVAHEARHIQQRGWLEQSKIERNSIINSCLIDKDGLLLSPHRETDALLYETKFFQLVEHAFTHDEVRVAQGQLYMTELFYQDLGNTCVDTNNQNISQFDARNYQAE